MGGGRGDLQNSCEVGIYIYIYIYCIYIIHLGAFNIQNAPRSTNESSAAAPVQANRRVLVRAPGPRARPPASGAAAPDRVRRISLNIIRSRASSSHFFSSFPIQIPRLRALSSFCARGLKVADGHFLRRRCEEDGAPTYATGRGRVGGAAPPAARDELICKRDGERRGSSHWGRHPPLGAAPREIRAQAEDTSCAGRDDARADAATRLQVIIALCSTAPPQQSKVMLLTACAWH
jgi:hypothetical protein